MAEGVPPENVEAVMGGPHLESAEGEAAEREDLLKRVAVDKGEVAPVVQAGHVLDNTRGDGLVGDCDASDEAHHLLPEGVLYQVSVPLLLDEPLIPPADLFLIQEDRSLVVAEADYDPQPLPLGKALLLLNLLSGGGVLDHQRLPHLDADLLSAGAYLADHDILRGPIEKKEAEDDADFLGGRGDTFLILICMSSKEWIVDS